MPKILSLTWNRLWLQFKKKFAPAHGGAPRSGGAPFGARKHFAQQNLAVWVEFISTQTYSIPKGPQPPEIGGWAGIEDVKDIIADLEQALANV